MHRDLHAEIALSKCHAFALKIATVYNRYWSFKIVQGNILQRIDFFAWYVRLSWLLVGFRTHFKSLHFHSSCKKACTDGLLCICK